LAFCFSFSVPKLDVDDVVEAGGKQRWGPVSISRDRRFKRCPYTSRHRYVAGRVTGSDGSIETLLIATVGLRSPVNPKVRVGGCSVEGPCTLGNAGPGRTAATAWGEPTACHEPMYFLGVQQYTSSTRYGVLRGVCPFWTRVFEHFGFPTQAAATRIVARPR
jgi:hypothetical protein